MSNLEPRKALVPGRVIHARVAGFLPGRKVVLDLGEQALVAWCDVPLVRGKVVRAIVDDAGPPPRLRVIRSPDDTDHATDFEQLVSRVAGTLGVPVTESLVREVGRHLQEAVPALQTGPVDWTELEPWLEDILAAHARGLPATRRAWGAMRIGSEARLGTALARLIEQLDAAAVHSRGQVRSRLSGWTQSLQDFFLSVDSGRLACLLEAAARCGYLHEPAHQDGGSGATHQPTLKATLLDVGRSLTELCEQPLQRTSIDFRRHLERAMAWCVQVLDILEGLQVQNMPVAGDTHWSVSLQIPVLQASQPGTVFLIASKDRARLWLEVAGSQRVHAAVHETTDGYDVDLSLPPGSRDADLRTDWCAERNVRLRVQPQAEALDSVDLVV